LAATADSDQERWRVFIALDLPADVRHRLQAPIDGLAPLADFLRPNAVERIHLTLHFLGHLLIADVRRIESTLESVIRVHRRLELEARGVGAFPNFGRAQVLWAGIEGADVAQLNGLQHEIGQVLEQDPTRPAAERFHPHLTLARIRRPIRGEAGKLLKEWHARWREASFGQLPVREVRLMRSQLGAGPPRYSCLASFSLQ
jgi:2'-5' RNA ligase